MTNNEDLKAEVGRLRDEAFDCGRRLGVLDYENTKIKKAYEHVLVANQRLLKTAEDLVRENEVLKEQVHILEKAHQQLQASLSSAHMEIEDLHDLITRIDPTGLRREHEAQVAEPTTTMERIAKDLRDGTFVGKSEPAPQAAPSATPSPDDVLDLTGRSGRI